MRLIVYLDGKVYYLEKNIILQNREGYVYKNVNIESKEYFTCDTMSC